MPLQVSFLRRCCCPALLLLLELAFGENLSFPSWLLRFPAFPLLGGAWALYVLIFDIFSSCDQQIEPTVGALMRIVLFRCLDLFSVFVCIPFPRPVYRCSPPFCGSCSWVFF
jgi:hypothetical protein